MSKNMSTEKSWKESKKTGDCGEKLVEELFKKRGFEVEDKTNDKEYFAKGIDFVLTKYGYVDTIEVKSCNRIWETGNFIVEDTMDIDNKIPGWLRTSQARVYVHVDLKNKTARLFEFKRLREFVNLMVEENKNNKEITTCKLKEWVQRDKASDYSNRIIKRLNYIVPMDNFINWNKKNNYLSTTYKLE